MQVGTRVAALSLALLGLAATARGSDPSLLVASGGAYDANKRRTPAAEIGLQYRTGGTLLILHGIAGAMVTTNGALNAYAGFSFDVPIGRAPVVRLIFAPGYYHQGNGKDLGYPLEFRSGVEVGWRFGNWRMGLELYHLSNASLARHNPGEESLALTLAIPLHP
jgi:lipid A 3-O-deacylase